MGARTILTVASRFIILGLFVWTLVFITVLARLPLNILWQIPLYLYWMFLLFFLFSIFIGIKSLIMADDILNFYNPTSSTYRYLERAVGNTNDLNTLYFFVVWITWVLYSNGVAGSSKYAGSDPTAWTNISKGDIITLLVVILAVLMLWSTDFHLRILNWLITVFHIYTCVKMENQAGVVVGVSMLVNYTFDVKYYLVDAILVSGNTWILEWNSAVKRCCGYLITSAFLLLFFSELSQKYSPPIKEPRNF